MLMSLRGTKQSVGLMQLSLNTFARKLTDCFTMLTMTKCVIFTHKDRIFNSERTVF